jgi:hypothetical protein
MRGANYPLMVASLLGSPQYHIQFSGPQPSCKAVAMSSIRKDLFKQNDATSHGWSIFGELMWTCNNLMPIKLKTPHTSWFSSGVMYVHIFGTISGLFKKEGVGFGQDQWWHDLPYIHHRIEPRKQVHTKATVLRHRGWHRGLHFSPETDCGNFRSIDGEWWWTLRAFGTCTRANVQSSRSSLSPKSDELSLATAP